jgi:hypothetical protein
MFKFISTQSNGWIGEPRFLAGPQIAVHPTCAYALDNRNAEVVKGDTFLSTKDIFVYYRDPLRNKTGVFGRA